MTSSSIQNLQIKGLRFIFCLIFGTLLLTGCEGPSTTVLKNEVVPEEEETVQLSLTVPASSAERLLQTVNTLVMETDMDPGSSEEYDASTDASVYIVSALRNCSYDVNQSGEIIEAVLTAENDNPDICLVIACYGSPEEGIYASDTAAGAAVLLETARDLAGFTGDTEIHFVFLPGGRDDTEYIYTYLSEVFTPDPDRLLGAVVLGGLGLNTAEENELGCVDAKETFMAEQINRICRADLGCECSCVDHSDGVMNALLRNRIPLAEYMQKGSIEAATVLDCPSLLDYDSLKTSADILSRSLALLIDEDTPSMQARAHYTDSADAAGRETFSWGKDTPIPFGKSEKTLESMTGLMGEQTSENTINNGKELLGYRFFTKWFGEDMPLPADFYYLSDELQTVQIRASDEGMDGEDICSAIDAFYGESPVSSDGPYGIILEWTMQKERLHITYQPLKEGYELCLEEYDTPVTVYPADSLGFSRLKNLYEQVIPEEARKDTRFEAYTDGYGGTIGRLTETSADPADTESSVWIIGLDLNDALNTDAGFKDKIRTTSELARLYGEYLALSDPALYYDGYRDRFGGDADDFASSFRLFSLAGEPAGEAGPAADKIRYFYDFDELTGFRDNMRDIR